MMKTILQMGIMIILIFAGIGQAADGSKHKDPRNWELFDKIL